MATSPVLYGITATLISDGRTVDLLGYRTATGHQVDDVCQQLRNDLRPTHGNALRITVKRR
jgi:hypothetical protein